MTIKQGILVLSAVVLAACAGNSQKLGEFTSVANRFIAAGAKHDSTTVRAVTLGEQPAAWLATAQVVEPELLADGGKGLRAVHGEIRGDTAIVEFARPQSEHHDRIGMSFVRHRGTWMINRVQLSNRF
jgi:hypothetical protein